MKEVSTWRQAREFNDLEACQGWWTSHCERNEEVTVAEIGEFLPESHMGPT